jgi:hypothetical protein
MMKKRLIVAVWILMLAGFMFGYLAVQVFGFEGRI